jgi:hypothetical protein
MNKLKKDKEEAERVHMKKAHRTIKDNLKAQVKKATFDITKRGSVEDAYADS